MTFEEWWSEHPIQKSDILPTLKLAFKEVALSAWTAARMATTCEVEEDLDFANHD